MMKLFTFAVLINFSLVLAGVLDTRQEQGCNADNCYRAVWPDNAGLLRILQGVEDCQDYQTTSVIWHPMYVQHYQRLFTLLNNLLQHYYYGH
jgi:hypothetical protein